MVSMPEVMASRWFESSPMTFFYTFRATMLTLNIYGITCGLVIFAFMAFVIWGMVEFVYGKRKSK